MRQWAHVPWHRDEHPKHDRLDRARPGDYRLVECLQSAADLSDVVLAVAFTVLA